MASPKTIARTETLIWVLIYGGLFTLVLGLATRRVEEATGWVLIVVGGVAAAVGFTLIWVRSRMREGP